MVAQQKHVKFQIGSWNWWFLRELQPVTQLYVSVDASCPESLKKI